MSSAVDRSPAGPSVAGRQGRRPPLTVLSLVALLLLPGACSAVAPVAPGADRVRAVVMPYLTFMPFHIAAEEGYFAQQNLEVEFIRLARIQELMTGLSRGDVDVAAGMLTATFVNSVAAGARLRLVGALGHLDASGCAFNGFVARSELMDSGALEDPARLRQLSWDADVLLPYGYWVDRALAPYGLDVDDLDLVNLPEAAAVDAVVAGAVDVTLVSEPFLGLLAASEEARVWRRSNEVAPDYQISVMMYGPNLLDERPAVGERFAAAMLAAIRQFMQGKTARNLEIVERASGLAAEQLTAACWPAARADARIPDAAFDDYQRWMVRRGQAERVLPDEELIDRRFFERANQDLANR